MGFWHTIGMQLGGVVLDIGTRRRRAEDHQAGE
jgi:hypothetical protein